METKCKTEIKTFYGKCSCCQQYGYLKSMWEEYQWNGKTEVYARMIVECFGLQVWYSTGNDDNVCFSCITSLREACTFKEVVKDAQVKLCQETDGHNITEIYYEDIHAQTKGPPFPAVQCKQESPDSDNEITVEYLEEDVLRDDIVNLKQEVLYEVLTDGECNNSEMSDKPEVVVQQVYSLFKIGENKPRKRKSRSKMSDKNETDIEDKDASPSKRSKKLPLNERHKTYRQYTTEDLKNCLEAVASNKMSPKEAAELYSIPQKTIANKLRGGALEEEDIWQKTPWELIGEVKTVLMYTNVTPFKTRFNHFLCAFCPAVENPTFYQPDDLRQHTEKFHPDRFNKVEFMLRPFHNNTMVKIDINNLKCKFCDLPSSQWSAMLDHLEKKHNLTFKMARTHIVPYVLSDYINCAICKRNFTNYKNVDIHMNSHYSNFTCAECGESFITLNRLKNHEKIHNTGTHKCDVCSKKFSSESNKNRHFKIHHGGQIEIYKCQYCVEKFPTDASRNKHVLEKHAEILKVINCEICGAIFYFNKAYLKHKRRRHSNVNQCSKCERNFDTPSLLNKHKLKGNCVKNYKCEICYQTTFTVSSLQRHMKMHQKRDNLEPENGQ